MDRSPCRQDCYPSLSITCFKNTRRTILKWKAVLASRAPAANPLNIPKDFKGSKQVQFPITPLVAGVNNIRVTAATAD